MPYISRKRRDGLKLFLPTTINTSGELNYLFTVLAQRYLVDNGMSYGTMNDIIGALEGCKLELYRRKVAPYEDIKIEENGDVY